MGTINTDKEYILCAAIKRKVPRDCKPYWDGVSDICKIEIGWRHHDIFQRFKDELNRSPSAQGFFTSKSRFVDRKEGMRIAYNAGQVDEERAFFTNEIFNDLYSEDLY